MVKKIKKNILYIVVFDISLLIPTIIVTVKTQSFVERHSYKSFYGISTFPQTNFT